MHTLTVWLLVMSQGGALQIVNTYDQAEKCFEAVATAPATTLAYCIEAKTAFQPSHQIGH